MNCPTQVEEYYHSGSSVSNRLGPNIGHSYSPEAGAEKRRGRTLKTDASIKQLSLAPASITQAGILMYVLTMPFGPSFPQVIRQTLLLMVIAGVILMRVGADRRAVDIPPYRLLLPMLAFLGSAVLSVIYSASPMMSLHYARFTPIAILLFLGIQQSFISVRSVHRLCAAACCVIVMLCVDGMYQFLSGSSLLAGHELWGSRVTGSIPHPNDLALIPILLPLVFILLAVSRRQAMMTRLMWLILTLAITTVLVSQSRAALIGVVVAIVTWAVVMGRARLLLLILALLAAGLTLAWLIDLGAFRSRLASLLTLHQEGRIGIWLTAWHMFLDFPIGGLGAHTFGEFYTCYLTEIALPSWYVPEVGFIPWAHNIYLEMLCERGLLGFSAFFILITCLVHRLLTSLRRTNRTHVRSIGAGLFCALSVFLVIGLVDLTFLKDWVSLVFWMMAALIARLPDLTDDAST